MEAKSTLFPIAIAVGIALVIAGAFVALRQEPTAEQNVTSLGTQPSENGAAPSVVQEDSDPALAQLAPDFKLERLDGGTIVLSQYRGEKPVVLDFWASWCPNCRRDMPVLNELYGKYQDQVEVIGVNLQESPAVAQRYIDEAGINFPIVLDPKGQASTAFGITYTNFHVLINKDGAVQKVIPGDINESDIVSLLQ